MVTLYIPETGKSICAGDKMWLKTLINVKPEHKLKRISSGTFSIVVNGVTFIVSNDWAIDDQYFTFNTDYMLRHNLL